ncbi:hypothetical protein DYBT9275_00300 [Dyadobacter sp. CECT 9275]|uniref:Glycosyltransferase 2-like domain-containing protein n=1 Tax=Dyadobacter helix TaxID=2822344 RepID=A0A916J8A9_9BACT|nr:glycosyltransferase family A protein [Dyadobacter sp. CECT 9275]CAG4989484.1 hypothetical protein DYBT9275_00300 [Dyadobacter sp. CECT 9275]
MDLSPKYRLLAFFKRIEATIIAQITKDCVNNRQQLASNKVYSEVASIINRQGALYPMITVITPSTGSEVLLKAIDSVLHQDFHDIVHLIVADGEDCKENILRMVNDFDQDRCKVMVLPFNTGRNGMNGHRIYAALPFLVNSEYIFFLDQDNWLDANHISSMICMMEKDKLDWVFSMRKIFTEDGVFVTNDNCESLGDYGCYSQLPNLVDTNCYGFRRDTLVRSAHYWYHPLRADRYFFHHLRRESPNYKCTGLYTVNYRLTENRSPYPEFFLAGNRFMMDKYRKKLPWVK